ncbi:MAG: hypothetical protein RL328_1887 [Acidobacteriota bacterium]
MKAPALLLLCAACALAEVHTLTLAQALARALDQNPDVMLSRLEVQRSKAQIEQTRDPFSLKLGVGSGMAYTYGFPASIDGNAPSIIQARGQMAIFDKPQSYRVEQAREAANGAALDIPMRQQEIAYRVTAAFLDAEHAARGASAAQAQFRSLMQVKQLTDVRVSDGRELAIESRRANLNALTAQNAADEFAYAGASAELTLAQLLGYPAGDRVKPALETREPFVVSGTQEQASAKAIADSLEIRKLESNLKAKQLEIKSLDATRLPKINLVSQYSLLARYNNFDVFYPRFQRNNAQIGASIEILIFAGKGVQAGKTQAEIDIEKLQLEITRTKTRIAGDIDQAYRDVDRAERNRTLRREALDLAREDLTVVMTQQAEGRATMAQVEAARAKEQEEWIRYYDAQRSADVARLNVRRVTGTVLAGVQ